MVFTKFDDSVFSDSVLFSLGGALCFTFVADDFFDGSGIFLEGTTSYVYNQRNVLDDIAC